MSGATAVRRRNHSRSLTWQSAETTRSCGEPTGEAGIGGIVRSVMVAAMLLTMAGGCQTDRAGRSPVNSFTGVSRASMLPARKDVAPMPDQRPIGGPHTRDVMAMDWPADLAPVPPPQFRKPLLPLGADPAYLSKIQAMEIDDQWGHHINPELVEALLASDTLPKRLAALDYSRDRVRDDRLSTQFLLVYARLLSLTAGYEAGAAQAILAADLTAIIDSARCAYGPGDDYVGLRNRRRDFAELYAKAREVLAGADAAGRSDVVAAVLRIERLTAATRKDEMLCRYGVRYMDLNAAQKVDCKGGLIGSCYAAADNKAVPTRWADEQAWHRQRISVLRELTPEKLVELYSRALPQDGG